MIDGVWVVLLMGVIIYPARGNYRSCRIDSKDNTGPEYLEYGWFHVYGL